MAATQPLPISPEFSPLAIQLLKTNFPPSAVEAAAIRAALEGETAKLATLDARIQHLQHAMDKLNSQRRRMKRSVTLHRSIISPLRRFPHEIIAEILLYACEGQHVYFPNEDEELESQMPWTFTFVCSKWRSVAIGLRALWRNINVMEPTKPSELVRVALERSRQIPLNFATRWTSEIDPSILLTIIPTSARWQHLMLEVSPDMLPRLEELKDNLPALETLHISTDVEGSWEEFVLHGKWLANAPKLRHLTIEGDWRLGSTKDFQAPWSQLLSVDYRPAEDDLLSWEIDRLCDMTSLTSHRMVQRGPFDILPDEQPHIFLDHMKELTVTTPGAPLTAILHVPNLQKLRWYAGPDSAHGEPTVAHMLQTAKRSLEEMQVTINSMVAPIWATRTWEDILGVWRSWEAPKALHIVAPVCQIKGLTWLLYQLQPTRSANPAPLLLSLTSLRVTLENCRDCGELHAGLADGEEYSAALGLQGTLQSLLDLRCDLLQFFILEYDARGLFGEAAQSVFQDHRMEDLESEKPATKIIIRSPPLKDY